MGANTQIPEELPPANRRVVATFNIPDNMDITDIAVAIDTLFGTLGADADTNVWENEADFDQGRREHTPNAPIFPEI